MARRRRIHHGSTHAWPGYVDALSTLLMIIIFVLLVFVLGQVFLSAALTHKERHLHSLAQTMQNVQTQLHLSQKDEQDLKQALNNLQQQHEQDQKASLTQQEQLARLQAQLNETQTKLTSTTTEISDVLSQKNQLSQTLDQLHHALENKTSQIETLSKHLNALMAIRNSPVAHLRTQFYTQLKTQLNNQKGLSIIDDRFVLQSEILFPPGDANLSPQGQKTIITLAKTLKEAAKQMPSESSWILRVDGHADKQPINSTYPSNWELSSARAITVVKLLIANGVAPEHLAATGFGEFHPLDPQNTQQAYQKNRRIEFRLTDK